MVYSKVLLDSEDVVQDVAQHLPKHTEMLGNQLEALPLQNKHACDYAAPLCL
jgi:hypothetical protein